MILLEIKYLLYVCTSCLIYSYDGQIVFLYEKQKIMKKRDKEVDTAHTACLKMKGKETHSWKRTQRHVICLLPIEGGGNLSKIQGRN